MAAAERREVEGAFAADDDRDAQDAPGVAASGN
jgi:hypothetical protein